jgi:hypothetical protein
VRRFGGNREVEEHRLVERETAEPGEASRDAQVELAASRRARDDCDRGRGFADAGHEHARVELVDALEGTAIRAMRLRLLWRRSVRVWGLLG